MNDIRGVTIISMHRRCVTNTRVPPKFKHLLRMVFCEATPDEGGGSVYDEVARSIAYFWPWLRRRIRARRPTSEIFDLRMRIWKGYIRLFVSVP